MLKLWTRSKKTETTISDVLLRETTLSPKSLYETSLERARRNDTDASKGAFVRLPIRTGFFDRRRNCVKERQYHD